MSWDEFFSNYRNFIFSVNKTKMLTITSNEVFFDYPDNIPDKFTTPLLEDLDDIEKLVGYIYESKIEKVKNWKYKSEITKHLLETIIIDIGINKEQMDVKQYQDYNRILLSHELIMYIAHLEAFINDAIRIFCNLKPKFMTVPKGEKKEEVRDN